MPSDGMRGEGTGYLPPAGPGAPDFESWIINDVINCVKEFAGPASDASPIFLGGNSMGGFGAGRLGCRYWDMVSGIALHSAITDLDQLAEFTSGDIAEEAGLAPPDRRLVGYFESCGDATPPLYMDCGTEDPLIDVNRELHTDLLGLGIAHVYEEYPGAHNWESWSGRITHSLGFFADQLD
jgi:putative tributyrin esterase